LKEENSLSERAQYLLGDVNSIQITTISNLKIVFAGEPWTAGNSFPSLQIEHHHFDPDTENFVKSRARHKHKERLQTDNSRTISNPYSSYHYSPTYTNPSPSVNFLETQFSGEILTLTNLTPGSFRTTSIIIRKAALARPFLLSNGSIVYPTSAIPLPSGCPWNLPYHQFLPQQVRYQYTYPATLSISPVL
jgi:hypothetical protein